MHPSLAKKTDMEEQRGPPRMIRVELRGQIFDIPYECLQQAPGSLLTRLAEDEEAHIVDGVLQLSINRSPVFFRSIHDFYLDGCLHLTPGTCIRAFADELNFWEIEIGKLTPCCWDIFNEARDKEQTLDKFRHHLTTYGSSARGSAFVQSPECSLSKSRLADISAFLNDPNSSVAAKGWSIFFICVILVSLVVMCVDTVPEWRLKNETALPENTTLNQAYRLLVTTNSNPIIRLLEATTLSVITLELLVARILLNSNRRTVIHCRFFWLTVFSLLASWFVLAVEFLPSGDKSRYFLQVETLYIVCYASRMFRLVYSTRLLLHWQVLCVMRESLSASTRELLLLVLLLLLGSTIYGTIIYLAEVGTGNIPHVPRGFWWAIITMTTVGYGDVYPVTLIGGLVGSACAVTGIIIVALPIPVIANRFNVYYSLFETVKRRLNKANEPGEKQVSNSCQSRSAIYPASRT